MAYITYYKCGHNHKAPVGNNPKDYIEWKYTYGFGGNKKLCYSCWKKDGNKS